MNGTTVQCWQEINGYTAISGKAELIVTVPGIYVYSYEYVRSYSVLYHICFFTAEFTVHPQSKVVTIGDSALFTCKYTLYVNNPYLLHPVWYINGTKVVNGSYNGSLVIISVDNRTSQLNVTTREWNLVAFNGASIQCVLESTLVDVMVMSNNAALTVVPGV